MKLTLWLTVWPWTEERSPFSYFVSSAPPSPSTGTGQQVYRVTVEVPDPTPVLEGVAELQDGTGIGRDEKDGG